MRLCVCSLTYYDLCIRGRPFSILNVPYHLLEFESERLDETFRIQVATTILFALFMVEFADIFTGISVHRHLLSFISAFCRFVILCYMHQIIENPVAAIFSRSHCPPSQCVPIILVPLGCMELLFLYPRSVAGIYSRSCNGVNVAPPSYVLLLSDGLTKSLRQTEISIVFKPANCNDKQLNQGYDWSEYKASTQREKDIISLKRYHPCKVPYHLIIARVQTFSSSLSAFLHYYQRQ